MKLLTTYQKKKTIDIVSSVEGNKIEFIEIDGTLLFQDTESSTKTIWYKLDVERDSKFSNKWFLAKLNHHYYIYAETATITNAYLGNAKFETSVLMGFGDVPDYYTRNLYVNLIYHIEDFDSTTNDVYAFFTVPDTGTVDIIFSYDIFSNDDDFLYIYFRGID